MVRKCPRTLDKPILLFGLELEDVAFVALGVGIGSLLVGPMVPGAFGAVAWAVLLRAKSNKPSGYLLHWLYMNGYQLPGLIPSPKKVKYYGAIR